MICCIRIRTRDIRSNIALRLGEFPRARPKGTPKGGGLYFTVYPESSMGKLILRILLGASTECSVYWKIHLAERTILKELSSNIPLLRMINFLVLFLFLKVRGISCLLDEYHIW